MTRQHSFQFDKANIIKIQPGRAGNSKKIRKFSLAFILSACWGMGYLLPANAENSATENPKKVEIEEVIITAEKREQNVQAVPAAISAFSAEMLEMRGVGTPQDLQSSVPSLDIAEQHTGGVAKVYLRGVGNENNQPGGDPGVPIHINGHYTQSTAYIFRDMVDVARVEVQRGPQGTLYGRNAMGGNINIITNRPTEEFAGMVKTTFGNYNKRNFQVVVSGPLGQNLRGRLAVVDDSRDGYVENLLGGDDRDSSNYTALRGALEFDLTDSVQLYLNAYYFDDVGNNATRVLSGDSNNPTVSDPFKIRANTESKQTDKSKGISLDITWNLDSVEFRSLTAYDDTNRVSVNDLDAGGKPDLPNEEDNWDGFYKTLTQEFQLLSSENSAVKWVAGVFYYQEKSGVEFLYLRDTNPGGLAIAVDPLDVEASSWAVYGQLDYSLTEQLEIVAGLRYTQDEKERLENALIGIVGSPLGPLYRFDRSSDQWDAVTGKLGFNYHFNNDVMAYLSWSRGYKSGGYNSTNEPPFAPEFLGAYETGLKSQWLDNKFQLNLAAFYYDYEDKQDIQRIPAPENLILFGLRNASAATVKGLEVEAQAYLTDALLVDLSLGYLRAQYDEFLTEDVTNPSLGVQDLSGREMPYSPRWTVHLGTQYTWGLGDYGELAARVDYSWKDERYVNGLNREGVIGLESNDLLDAYYLLNAQLRWESNDATWDAVLYAENLTDEVVQTLKSGTPVGWASYLAPRTYGLTVQYSF